jgi:hypothetical protein
VLSAPFMPVAPPLSLCMAPPLSWLAAPPPDDGYCCCIVDPADPASRLVPVPCAFAKPVPAISAAAATEIRKRLVILSSPQMSALPAPTTKGDRRCSARSTVPPILFSEWQLNDAP